MSHMNMIFSSEDQIENTELEILFFDFFCIKWNDHYRWKKKRYHDKSDTKERRE